MKSRKAVIVFLHGCKYRVRLQRDRRDYPLSDSRRFMAVVQLKSIERSSTLI